MRYQITATSCRRWRSTSSPGETVYSQTNTMAWMNDAVTMDTHTGGGFLAGLKRSFGGGSFFITDFTARARATSPSRRDFPGRSCRAAASRPIADLPQGDIPGRARNR